jgi:hypothetical protein
MPDLPGIHGGNAGPDREKELGRLVSPLPDMTNVLNSLGGALKFL